MCPEEENFFLDDDNYIPFFAKFVPRSYNRTEKTTGGSHETAFRFYIFSVYISIIVSLYITAGARRGFSSSEPGAYL